MQMFPTQEKLYFVFAGPGERYFLENALRVNTLTYLWMNLKECHYNGVFYVGQRGAKYRVKMLDDYSKKRYERHWVGLKKVPQVEAGKNYAEINDTMLRKWLSSLFTKQSDANDAVVFDLLTFCALYNGSDGKRELDTILDHQFAGKTVVLIVPSILRPEHHEHFVDAREQAKIQLEVLDRLQKQLQSDDPDVLKDDYISRKKAKLESIVRTTSDSVFVHQTKVGNYICDDLRILMRAESPIHIFEELKKRIGNRFIDLCTITIPRIQNMVQCVGIHKNEIWPLPMLASYSNALYLWWYLPEIMWSHEVPATIATQLSQLFTDIRGRSDTISALYDKLRSYNGWSEFESVLSALHGSCAVAYSNLLLQIDKQKLEKQSHVYLDNATLTEISELVWPESIYTAVAKINPVLNVASKLKWNQMQADLKVPRNRTIPKQRLYMLGGFYRYYTDAVKCGDYETACRAINAMLFCGTHLYYDSNLRFRQRFTEYSSYLNVSKSYYEIRDRDYGTADHLAEKAEEINNESLKTNYLEYLRSYDAMLSDITQWEREDVDLAEGMNNVYINLRKKLLAGMNESEDIQYEDPENEDTGSSMTEDEANARLQEIQRRQFI